MTKLPKIIYVPDGLKNYQYVETRDPLVRTTQKTVTIIIIYFCNTSSSIQMCCIKHMPLLHRIVYCTHSFLSDVMKIDLVMDRVCDNLYANTTYLCVVLLQK